MADVARMPTAEEIAELPRWAQVAFAIRCARRVQPLFLADWPDAPPKYVVAIEKAIKWAERTLSGHEDTSAYTRAAADAAYAAAAAAADTADTADTAAAYAADTAWAYVANAKAVWRDFDMLMEMSKREHWTDETRPSLESLGPLWLEGEEPDWKDIARRTTNMEDKKQATGDQKERHFVSPFSGESVAVPRRVPRRTPEGKKGQEEKLLVSAFVDEPVDDDSLVEGITELYRALNRYHILCGGSGLTIDDWQILVRAGAPQGVLA
jgi:hypothetical protein